MRTRLELAKHIADRLEAEKISLANQFAQTNPIRHFFIDNVLPAEICLEIHSCFPTPSDMRLRKSIRELKFISAQMDKHTPLLEEAIYAFQEPCVVDAIAEIVGKKDIVPDEHLYAGGISMMGPGHFLNPHLDNSHDKDRNLWRNLNLLHYVTPEWPDDVGGNLEVWPTGPKGKQTTIVSRFNRLAVLETHHEAWHSVSPITGTGHRCCVSNYYFSATPMRADQEFHVTSFRGRPEQPLRDVVLRADSTARMGVRALFKNGIVENKHKYVKQSESD